MRLGHAQVLTACLCAVLYTGLGLFGASRVWASRFSTRAEERSLHLAFLSGGMNIVSVVVLLAQIATVSAGGVFPCGITSTVSHFYVLLCVLPLVLRKTGDSALWARRIVPATSTLTLLAARGPLLATTGSRYRYNIGDVAHSSKRSFSLQRQASSREDQDDHTSDKTQPQYCAEEQAIKAKFALTALVVMVGAVTALSIWAGGGSWSIRGRYRDKDGSCFPMESWHLIASWATCATLAGVSYATTKDPERPDPRAMVCKWKAAVKGVESRTPGPREERSGSVATVVSAWWWLRCVEWRRQPCPLRREKLVMALVSVWFGGFYLSLLWRQPELNAGQRKGFLTLLVLMNAFLLLSTFWLVVVEWMSQAKPLTASDLAKLRTRWSSTKDVMSNPNVAAKFRDAARAHFCEELYKFLAAFQQFEEMNVDEEVEEGGGLNVRPFGSPLGTRAESTRHRHNKHLRKCRSYQVLRYSAYVGMLGEFFMPGCRHEVNVSSETRQHVRKLLKFCDWVDSSEQDKRKVFSRAAAEVRMMLDQNVMGSFIQSSTFAGVARDLVAAERFVAKEEGASKRISGEELKRSELRHTLTRGIRSVAVVNSAKSKWAEVAAESRGMEEGDGEGGTRGSVHSAAGVPGAGVPVRKSPALRSAALGVLATKRYAALTGTGDHGDAREELPPLSVSVSAPPRSPAGTSTMVHVTSAPPRPTPPASPSVSTVSSARSAYSAHSAPSLPSAVTTPRLKPGSPRRPASFRAAAMGALAVSRPGSPDRYSSNHASERTMQEEEL